MKYESGTQVAILQWTDLEGNTHMALAKGDSIKTTLPDFTRTKVVDVDK